MSSDPHSPIQAQLASPPPQSSSPQTSSPQASPRRDGTVPAGGVGQWVNHRGAVLALLFLVTGALGIPLLWMNSKFSTFERLVWTILVTLYTAALIYGAYLVVMWSYRQILG